LYKIDIGGSENVITVEVLIRNGILAENILSDLDIPGESVSLNEELEVAFIVIRGIIPEAKFKALLTEVEKASRIARHPLYINRVRVSMYGMVSTGKVEPDAITKRLRRAGISVKECVVNDAENCVEMISEVCDAPEARTEQGHAVDQVIEYIAPMKLVFNGREIPAPSAV
jgi:hypothetical protein